MNVVNKPQTAARPAPADTPYHRPRRHRKVKRVISVSGTVFILLAALFLITGYFASKSYTGSSSRIIHAPVQAVWALLNDTQRFCKYRHQVQTLHMMPADERGRKQWREHTALAGDMYFAVALAEPEQVLVTQMLSSDFGMHGTWEFRLFPEGNDTRVVITEQSYTDGLVMRSILNTLGRGANLWILQNAIEKGIDKAIEKAKQQ